MAGTPDQKMGNFNPGSMCESGRACSSVGYCLGADTIRESKNPNASNCQSPEAIAARNQVINDQSEGKTS
jgi:hypothetical protein